MSAARLPASIARHRVRHRDLAQVCDGTVRFSWKKGAWFFGMAATAIAGMAFTVTPGSIALYVSSTAVVLLFGHSLGSHRKLIHGSFECPTWLEYTLVYLGVQVGLAGPLGLLRQHELRDFAQRLPHCHSYLRHGSSFWRDAWWQLVCELHLTSTPELAVEPRLANSRFYVFLERTWMAQQIPWALLFYFWGGWAFVFAGVSARVATGVFGHWIIGWFAHNEGGMHRVVDGAAVQGRNVRWTSLLTMGESWHNNHHAFPGSARLGLESDEWDPGWWALCGLQRLGLVWNIRLPSDLPPREELMNAPPQPRRLCCWRGSRRLAT
jgi:fatty-acid desaturase